VVVVDEMLHHRQGAGNDQLADAQRGIDLPPTDDAADELKQRDVDFGTPNDLTQAMQDWIWVAVGETTVRGADRRLSLDGQIRAYFDLTRLSSTNLKAAMGNSINGSSLHFLST